MSSRTLLLLACLASSCRCVVAPPPIVEGCDGGECAQPNDDGGQGGGGGVGGSGGGAGGADGGDVDAGVCNAQTCPLGCCDGTHCVETQSSQACGVGGARCEACTDVGSSCVEGACTGCLASCTSGCCVGNTCTTRTVDACGFTGAVCAACGPRSDGCSADGVCQCGGGPACGTGQKCEGGLCRCDPTTCAGCCAGRQCISFAIQTKYQCGAGGVQCGGCQNPPSNQCSPDAGAVLAFTSPGLCATGQCVYSQRAVACGFGCEAGSCVNDSCQGCLRAPDATCMGSTRRSYVTPGICQLDGGCSFSTVDEPCVYGCSNGACNADPCAGVLCQTPPPPRCEGSAQVTSNQAGACVDGRCTYGTTSLACPLGCNATTGRCNVDLCVGVNCTTPPAASCDGGTRIGFLPMGSCANGICSYAVQTTPCANGCDAGTCQGDPCQGVLCNVAPAAVCLNGTTRRTYASMGTCAMGQCSYTPVDTMCMFGCANNDCNLNPCIGVSCNVPPAPTCANSTTRRTFAMTGTCSAGTCTYAPTDTACNAPPATACLNTMTLRTFAPVGACSGGTCSYAPMDTNCAFGCSGAQCNANPCASVTCTTPPAATCANGTTKRTYSNPGQCNGSTCSYPSLDTVCNTPPAPVCMGATLRTFTASGTCSGGTCSYSANDTTCANGCSNGACNGDPCSGVACTAPPPPVCASPMSVTTSSLPGTCSMGVCSYSMSTTTCTQPPAPYCEQSGKLITFPSVGACDGGVCGYAPMSSQCFFGCANGACNPDPCTGVSCTTPPGPDCADATTRRTYSAMGTCSGGTCSYPASTFACNMPPAATCNGNSVRTYSSSGTCSGGACNYAPTDTPCNTPPPPSCSNGTLTTYSANGTCSNATCSYAPSPSMCPFGTCANATACGGDPCAMVSCNSPPAPTCSGPTTRLVYSIPGTCSGGSCSYALTSEECPNGCLNGACVVCNMLTCSGCCDALGVCQTSTDEHCGRLGGQCRDCLADGLTGCVLGRCVCGTSVCQPGRYCCILHPLSNSYCSSMVCP